MMFWLVVAALTAMAVWAVTRPLRRGTGAVGTRAEYDVQVYRDQLSEIERDRARNVLTADQADAARLEVERRLLGAADRRTAPAPAAKSASAPLMAIVVAAVVPVAVFALYLMVGSPGTPGQPLAERRDRLGPGEIMAHDPAAPSTQVGDSMVALTERLARRLREKPDDAEGWALLARSYQQIDRMRDAVAAYEKAAELADRHPEMVSALAESRVSAADGVVTPQARAEFVEVLGKDKSDPRAQFYLALADEQAGKGEEALARLQALAKETPAEAPYLAAVREKIAELARAAKRNPAEALAGLPSPAPPPARPAVPPRGPSAAEVAAAEKMTAEDRQAMIRGMVSGLAQRMQQNPKDTEGWIRLARAYKVLGEDAKAADAIAQGIAANPGERAALQEAARQLALAAPAQPAPPPAPPRPPASAPGPTQADVAAAQGLSPGQREAMIRGMVDGLAERMAQNPGDVEGWQRLVRAYKVLGEDRQAAEALAKAVAANPAERERLVAFAGQLGIALPPGR